jgi:molybdopterin molybdotransferase
MDGYALAGDDLPLNEPREYRVAGTAYAGEPYPHPCNPGECVRIMTGAPIPAGTDTVVMQEQAEQLSRQRVLIAPGQNPGQNVRRAGEDIARGHEVLEIGRSLTAADLGVMASLGIAEAAVRRRPRVAFFSTGNELRSPGEHLGEGDVYDSNRYSLYAMLKRLGVEMLDLGVIPDDPDALGEAFASAAAMADVVITSGGVSVGEADYVKEILGRRGRIDFWKIAMKPGRPLAFGRLQDALFFGLPGNPVAVMVAFQQFVEPALRYLESGRPWHPLTLHARSEVPMRKRPGRCEFQRGILSPGRDGQLNVTLSGRQGSGILSSMSRANCFVLLDEECAGIDRGAMVEVQPFDPFHWH